jgi:hypothetical protein
MGKIMKSLLSAIILLSASSAFAASGLEITGFRQIKNISAAKIYHFQDKEEFIISKNRFDNVDAARSFCKSMKSKLDTELSTLVIAMSGAAEADKFLNQSITFKIKKNSGVWQWIGTNDNVVLLIDGQGMRDQELSVDELSKITKVSLPAICVRSLK